MPKLKPRRRHIIIPDTQVKPNVPIDHLRWIGNYIVMKQPDVIVHLGDHADMPSLSSYDKGKKSFEGRRYIRDVEASINGMNALLTPIATYNEGRQPGAKYLPELHLLLGNHEERILRAVESQPELDGTIGIHDLRYSDYGWTVHDYLDVVEIDGIRYSHFFPRSATGRVMQSKRGAPSAKIQVQREMKSCVSGHLQGLDYYIYQGARRMHGIQSGSCYLHEEAYLSPQGTQYWRGIIILHEVSEGQFDPMFVSLGYLCRRYENMELDEFLKSDRVNYA